MHAIRLSVASFGSAGPATFVAAPGKHERFKAGGDVLLAALKKSWPELGSARVAPVRADRERPFRIDECHRTSVRGCYAASDAVTRYHQVALAAASGVAAAIAINDDLTCENVADLARA